MHDDGDDDHGDYGGEQDTAAIHERRCSLDARHHGHQAYERDAAHGVERQPHVAVQMDLVIRAKLVRRPYERKPCADEQAECAGVGSVVHARGVGIGIEQKRHLKRGCQCEYEGGVAHMAALHAELVRKDEDYGPNHIELLLDGKRPEMGDGAWGAQCVEVGHVAQDVPPVGNPAKRSPHVLAQLREQAVVEQRAEHGGAYDDEGDGREQAFHAAQPELGQVDGTRGIPFDKLQAGDEVA